MRVVKVEYLGEYKLKILFSDKKIKIVDLAEIVKNATGMLARLKNLDYFKKVTVDDCQLSICWPNGIDLCPDVLYGLGKDPRVVKRRRSTSRTRRRKTTKA